ncbi:hypothetical protein [Phenylobacterium sp.]|uniref:hypothetical protein n=1 Tax=Phenylobacterium sp. TaxID=1871053 RepID=UPI002C98EF7B|nr:hypothetical protein [Phenylobacterium sp.]HVI32791.1 hypothetical protein [Phenylobacterium sp.]
MRKLISAAVAGLAMAGGAAVMTSTAEAQPYGYYPAPPAYYGGYNSQPYYGGYNQPYYGNGYNGYYSQPYAGGDPLTAGMAALGAALGLNTQSGYGGYGYGVPVDRYGPDPNGMIAPDGHRIKCKLRRTYDSYYRSYVTRRVCR